MKQFTPSLLDWFAQNKRTFPWRNTADPYRIWVSEIMSHQTQIDRVADKYYPRFIEKFPSLSHLAKSNWENVYPVWEGLGYYSRGKNMLKTAKIISEEFCGHFPRDFSTLQTFPGIGAYTAAAILSFAFDDKIAAVDTNISRIINALWPEKNIQKVAQLLISEADSGRSWNSAMMDLSFFLRTKKEITAPLNKYFPTEMRKKFIREKRNNTKQLKNKKRKNYVDVGIACIWRSDGKYLIQSRPAGKSFVGSWEFPGGKREKGEDFRTCVKREIAEELGIKISVRPHFFEKKCKFNRSSLKLRFHRCQIQIGDPASLENQVFKWVSPSEFDQFSFLDTNDGVLERLKKMRT